MPNNLNKIEEWEKVFNEIWLNTPFRSDCVLAKDIKAFIYQFFPVQKQQILEKEDEYGKSYSESYSDGLNWKKEFNELFKTNGGYLCFYHPYTNSYPRIEEVVKSFIFSILQRKKQIWQGKLIEKRNKERKTYIPDKIIKFGTEQEKIAYEWGIERGRIEILEELLKEK